MVQMKFSILIRICKSFINLRIALLSIVLDVLNPVIKYLYYRSTASDPGRHSYPFS